MPVQEQADNSALNTSLYVLAVVFEAGVIAVLWMLGRIYG